MFFFFSGELINHYLSKVKAETIIIIIIIIIIILILIPGLLVGRRKKSQISRDF